jgi:virginiamycin B lyase
MTSLKKRGAWSVSLALAGLLVAAGAARAQITDVIVTDTPNSGPSATTKGPDGTIWFVETTGNRLGSLNPARTDVAEVNLKLPNSQPTDVTVDGFGRVWFTESGTNRIGMYTPSTRSLVEYFWGGFNLGLAGISTDSQGRVFFTEKNTNRIGILDPSRLTLQYYNWASGSLGLQDIACDRFGRAWFTESFANRIGVVDPYWNYVYDYYYAGNVSSPYGIAVDADNDVWFTEQAAGAISMLDTSTGQIFQFDAIGGASAQPKFIDTMQNSQNQTIVAWSEPVPGSGRIGLLNADTGARSQIPASTPFAAPTGVTFAPDFSLWWTEYNTSQLTGSFMNSSIVRGPSTAPRVRLASMKAIGLMPSVQAVTATMRDTRDLQILLVKKEDKAKGKGREKQSQAQKKIAKIDTLPVNSDVSQATKKERKHKKGKKEDDGDRGGGHGGDDHGDDRGGN